MTRCRTCDATLAHDQRYCIHCGTRRGQLPPRVAQLIAQIRERGQAALPASVIPAAAEALTRPARSWMPNPRVAVLTVMAMLAFGAEIGAAVTPSGLATAADGPLVVVRSVQAPPRTPTTVAQAPSTTPAATTPAPAQTTPSAPATPTTPAAPVTPTTPPTSTTPTTTNTNPYGLPAIKHVFVIMLGDAGYSQTFGSTDPYMSKTLPKQGKLVEYYYGVAGGELANELALVSGQGPTPQTEADCSTYANVTPGTISKHHQALGQGCVYPRKVKTLGSQLTAAHLTEKAYIQGMDGSSAQAQSCVHPKVGAADPNAAPQTGNPYVTWRNPLVYFHSLSAKACHKDDVDFSQLSTDLTQETTTPNVSLIVPDLCDDGSAQPCTPGGTAGVAAADSFLGTVLPEIKNSAAYQAGGLIVVTFDQAPQTGTGADPSACCATPKYPNLPAGTAPTSTAPTTTSTTTTTTTTTTPTTSATTPTTTAPTTTTTAPSTTTTSATTPTTTAPATTTPTTPTTTTPTTTTPASGLGQGQVSPTGGGGQVGMMLISPWIKKGTIDAIDYYNHYSLLASIEDIFNLKHIGYAKQSGLPVLDSSTFDGKGPSGG